MQYFLLICDRLNRFIHQAEGFNLDEVRFFFFFFSCESHFNATCKNSVSFQLPKFCPYFFSRSFIILYLLPTPKINFGLVFLHGVRFMSKLIFCLLVSNYFRTIFLKRLVFLNWITLAPLFKINWTHLC